MEATLTSTKATRTMSGDLAEILMAAICMDAELQPAGGVTIECDDGRTFECQDERIDVYTDGAEGEDGVVMIAGGELMIAWEQGSRTRFADANLQPA